MFMPSHTFQFDEILPMKPTVHRGGFCRFPFRWIYYCHRSKSTGKETGEMHLFDDASVFCDKFSKVWQYYLGVVSHHQAAGIAWAILKMSSGTYHILILSSSAQPTPLCLTDD